MIRESACHRIDWTLSKGNLKVHGTDCQSRKRRSSSWGDRITCMFFEGESMRRLLFVTLLSLLVCSSQVAAKHRILFNRYRVPEIGLFVADADGKNERALVPHHEIEYSP